MDKKKISILIAVIMVFCLVFALTACGDKGSADNGPSTEPAEQQTETPQGGDTSQTDQTTPAQNTPSGPIAKYHISFYTGEGATQVESITGKAAGDAITAPAEPKLPHNTFDGWYTDYGTYEQQFTFDTMPATNLCLYAKWTSTVQENELKEYKETLLETSEEGCLYIHYMRFDNQPDKYEPLNLWVWAYGFTGRVFDWERDDKGDIIVDDIAGATCVVNLKVKYTDAGKEADQEMQYLKTAGNYASGDIANTSNYMDDRIGFLIVYEDSKGVQGSHWRSDGNADQLFNIKDALWTNNSLHVFCVQDNVSSFTFDVTAEQQSIVNPYENDDGTHVSTANVNSSEAIEVKHGTQLFDTVSGVGYQIMVASFADSNGDGIGDIRGIIEKLDYIKSLNVNVIWLTPIQLSDSYHGYDIIDYKAVDPKFGTIDDYRELLRECHDRGIKVIMDLVLNHTSTNNVWFQNSAKMIVEDGIDYRSFYQWRNHEQEVDLSDDWYPYSEYSYSYYGKFSPSMPELNYDYQGTRDAIADVAKYWLGILGDGKGVDGFRIDAVKHIYMADEARKEDGDIIISDYDEETHTDYSSNLTKNLNFFCWLINTVKDDYPKAYFVGENFDGHAYNVAPYYTAYDGMLDFYMYYNFGELATYHSAASSLAGGNAASGGSVPSGENTDKLLGGTWSYAGVLAAQQEYSRLSTGEAIVLGSLFSSNHDIPRLVNNVVRTYVGKDWSAGTVTQENSEFAQKYAKAILATMMTMPGISWIYYGDELGMSSNLGAGEDANSPHVDRQYRQPFKWTTADYDKGGSEYITHYSISGDVTYYVTWDEYNKSLAGCAEQDEVAGSFLNTVRYWTELKSTDNVIRYGDYQYKQIDWGGGEAPLFSFTRSYNGKTYWVITNFSDYDYNVSGLVGRSEIIAITPGCAADALASGATIVFRIK